MALEECATVQKRIADWCNAIGRTRGLGEPRLRRTTFRSLRYLISACTGHIFGRLGIRGGRACWWSVSSRSHYRQRLLVPFTHHYAQANVWSLPKRVAARLD